MARLINAALIFLICTKILTVTANGNNDENCSNVDLKCTKKDPRNVYRKCMLYKKTSALYCNQSKMKKIPDPDKISNRVSYRNVTSLFVDDSCLESIKKNELKKYENINVFLAGQNYIKVLPDRLFSRNKKLRKIDFCGNEISVIDPTAFAGLSQLETLILASNKFTHIPDFLFLDLTSLTYLSFHNNKISVLHYEVFQGMKNLKVLKLTANRISFIDKKAFVGLDSLTELHLDENRLTHVVSDVFIPLKYLQVLTISHNKMTGWINGNELHLGSLHTIDFSSNLISKLESYHLSNMENLQNLSMENNSLTFLSDDIFLATTNLKYLNFADNNLHTIANHTFSNLPHLRALIIRNNELTTPEVGWFTRIVGAISNSTGKIDISGNPWNCDCNVLAYERFLEKLEIGEIGNPSVQQWSKSFKIICSSPDHLKSRELDRSIEEIILKSGCKSEDESPTSSTTTMRSKSKTSARLERIDKNLTTSGTTKLPRRKHICYPVEHMMTVTIWVIVVMMMMMIAIFIILKSGFSNYGKEKRNMNGIEVNRDEEKLIEMSVRTKYHPNDGSYTRQNQCFYPSS